jgi:hypothetical protein
MLLMYSGAVGQVRAALLLPQWSRCRLQPATTSKAIELPPEPEAGRVGGHRSPVGFRGPEEKISVAVRTVTLGAGAAVRQ